MRTTISHDKRLVFTVLALAALAQRAATADPCSLPIDGVHRFVTAAAPADNTVVANAPGTSVTFRWTVDWNRMKSLCPGIAWQTRFQIGVGPLLGRDLSTRFLDTGELTSNPTTQPVPLKTLTDGLANANLPVTADLTWVVWVKAPGETSSAVGTSGTIRIAAGPPDLVLIASPPAGWPSEFVVKNLGSGPSEATTLHATVALLQADVETVARNCTPRLVDFEDVVPPLQPKTGLATVRVLTQIKPEALAAWNALNKPSTRGRPAPAKTPTPLPNPVQQMVTCRYTLTAVLGTGQNRNDPHPQDNSLKRDITEYVPIK
jgi:hypothetical protein